MSYRRNSSRNNSIIPFLLVAIFIGIALEIPILVFGAIAYGIYRLSTSQQRRGDDRSRRRDYERGPYRGRYQPQTEPQSEARPQGRAPRRPTPRPVPKANPFKISGIKKYKDYEYEEAIEDFKKALTIDPNDIAVHFNIACAYSIMEQPDKALIHLDKAVRNGFKDFDKIQNHDALAYVRIQDEFENFVKNGYKLGQIELSPEEKTAQSNNLLEQLQKLGELREQGLLTEEEFQNQKKKLLG